MAGIEQTAPLLARVPRLVNFALQLKPVSYLLQRYVGYVDSPLLSVPTLAQRTSNRYQFDLNQLQQMSASDRSRVVLSSARSFYQFL